MQTFDKRLFILSAILFAVIACLLITLLDIRDQKRKQIEIRHKLSWYFGCHIGTQICYLVYFYNSPFLVCINWLFILVLVSVPVCFYATIFMITHIEKEEKLSRWHYFTPCMLSLVMLVLTFTTPIEEQLLTFKGNGLYRGDSFLFSLFSTKLIFRFGFNIVYIYLSYVRLRRYKQYIKHYSANVSRSSLNWINILLISIISLTLVPVYGLFVSRSGLANSPVALLQTVLILIQNSYLVYHILRKDYILVEHSTKKEEKQSISSLVKEEFEQYIMKEKPYLKPNLKITDLANDLAINRTYISSFINQEYEMNFSNYESTLRTPKTSFLIIAF